jgi:hypothetical protein
MMKLNKIGLWKLLITLIMISSGCWQSKFIFYHDIISKPSSQWEEHDCRAVIETHTEYNKLDNDMPVRIVATELTPLVFMAINRENQRREQWSEAQYVSNLYEDVHRYLGLTVKPGSDSIYDVNGYPYKNEVQADSLLFLVSILKTDQSANISNPALLGNIFDLKSYSFYDPDLRDLKDKIFLQNGQGMLLKPNWVGGKENGELIRKESFIVMFQLRQPSEHFFENSHNMTLVVRGFDRDIRLTFQITPM